MRRGGIHLEMEIPIILLLLVLAGLPLTGCNDGCDCCDLPTAGRDWLIEVELGLIPDPVNAYPIFVDVFVEVRDLENGGLPPDGLMASLAISPGSFDNGLTEIELALVGGHASATLQISSAGVYELAVSLQGDERVLRTTFTVGL